MDGMDRSGVVVLYYGAGTEYDNATRRRDDNVRKLWRHFLNSIAFERPFLSLMSPSPPRLYFSFLAEITDNQLPDQY